MARTADQILDEAMTLSAQERVRVAERLLQSVDNDEHEEISEKWIAEIERRIDNLKSGRTSSVPAEQFLDELETKLRNQRR